MKLNKLIIIIAILILLIVCIGIFFVKKIKNSTDTDSPASSTKLLGTGSPVNIKMTTSSFLGVLKDPDDNKAVSNIDPVYMKWVDKAIKLEKAKNNGVVMVSVRFDGSYWSYGPPESGTVTLNGDADPTGVYTYYFGTSAQKPDVVVLTPLQYELYYNNITLSQYNNYQALQDNFNIQSLGIGGVANNLYPVRSTRAGFLKDPGDNDALSTTDDVYMKWVGYAIQVENIRNNKSVIVSVWLDGGYKAYQKPPTGSVNLDGDKSIQTYYFGPSEQKPGTTGTN